MAQPIWRASRGGAKKNPIRASQMSAMPKVLSQWGLWGGSPRGRASTISVNQIGHGQQSPEIARVTASLSRYFGQVDVFCFARALILRPVNVTRVSCCKVRRDFILLISA